MNNSPERRVNGYVISQSKIHFQDRQSIVFCCCMNGKKFKKNKKAACGRFKKDHFIFYTFLTGGATCLVLPIQTRFPCILRTRNIIPTKMKKKGPRKPSKAINFVP